MIDHHPVHSSASAFVHGGLPSFMRARLYEARSGGQSGYESAGFSLGTHLDSQVPDEADVGEWEGVLTAVDAFIDDDSCLTNWLAITYPRILAAVPARRRRQFASGVRRGRQEAG